MVFLVPYDGSSVSEAALHRAVEHGEALEEDVVAVSLIPTGSEYAERRKWIQPDEEFALDTARSELKRKIAETTDDSERPLEGSGATSAMDGASDQIRRVASEVDASVLFVGTSKNGADEQVTTPFGTIAQDAEYDVHLVRSA
jgi:nucleotide-binding universal stress UspA family protein